MARGYAQKDSNCNVCKRPIEVGHATVWAPRAPQLGSAHESCFDRKKQHLAPLPFESLPRQEVKTTVTVGERAAMRSEVPTSTPTVERVTTLKTGSLESLVVDAILPILEERFQPAIDEESISQLIDSSVQKYIQKATRVEVYNPATQEVKDCGIQHKQFADLLVAIQARNHKNNKLNFWIVGSAGTGKTSAAENVASALGLNFAYEGSIVDVCSQIFGYYRPHDGVLIRTPFRDIWENGGVFCFDDFDGSIPNEAMKLNTLLAGGLAAFPDGMIKRHADCVIILTANTFGQGATSDYVGRLKQDGAFLDRFSFITWELDEELERATCPNGTWVSRVQSIRAKVIANSIKVLVTPRASYDGAALLAAGMAQDKVEAMTIRKAMTNDQWALVSR